MLTDHDPVILYNAKAAKNDNAKRIKVLNVPMMANTINTPIPVLNFSIKSSFVNSALFFAIVRRYS